MLTYFIVWNNSMKSLHKDFHLSPLNLVNYYVGNLQIDANFLTLYFRLPNDVNLVRHYISVKHNFWGEFRKNSL